MALPQQLKASPTRAASTDLGSTVPATLGALESALCDIFGFTSNTDITASPFGCDNSGNLTKQLILQKAAGPVGWRFLNSTNGTEMRICINGTNLDFDQNTGTESVPIWTNRFRIAISTGALTGQTFTTSSAGLAPASDGDPTKFLKADGTYGVPSAVPATSCRLSNSTNQNSLNNAFTTLSFDTEEWDSGSMHSGANPTRITFPTAGKYMVTAMANWNSAAAGRRLIDIWMNGSIIMARGETDPATTSTASASVSTLIDANANDYVEAVVWQNSGGTVIVGGAPPLQPSFGAFKIGG